MRGSLFLVRFLPGSILLLLLTPAGTLAAQNLEDPVVAGVAAWWAWPLALVVLTFFMGILAALGGIGGGVLFVPIVSAFFPFHFDFVRGAGLLVALSGDLAAGPGFLRLNLASLRLAMPLALMASTAAVFGAQAGQVLPVNVVETAMGFTILGIVILMILAKESTYPDVPESDRLSSVLKITGVFTEASVGQKIHWKVHRTDTSAVWVYINAGAVIPMMVVPSIVGIMGGSFIGVRILRVAKPSFVKWIVIGLLLFCGVKTITKGLDLPFLF